MSVRLSSFVSFTQNEMKIPLITRKMWESGLIMSVCLHRTVNFKGKTFSWKMTNLQFGWESKTKIFTSWDSAFVSFTSFFHQLNLKKKIVRRIKDTHTHFFLIQYKKFNCVCVCGVWCLYTRGNTQYFCVYTCPSNILHENFYILTSSPPYFVVETSNIRVLIKYKL